jgi:hypothetical protein
LWNGKFDKVALSTGKVESNFRLDAPLPFPPTSDSKQRFVPELAGFLSEHEIMMLGKMTQATNITFKLEL